MGVEEVVRWVALLLSHSPEQLHASAATKDSTARKHAGRRGMCVEAEVVGVEGGVWMNRQLKSALSLSLSLSLSARVAAPTRVSNVCTNVGCACARCSVCVRDSLILGALQCIGG